VNNPVLPTLNRRARVHLSPTPIRPDSVRCHCDHPVARLVWRISRLGDKIKIPIDLIRPFSNTPDSGCFLTLSLPLRSAYELGVIVFMLYNIRKHVVSFGCPRVGLSPAGFDSVDPSRSTSRGYVLYRLPSLHSLCGLESCVTPNSPLLLHHLSSGHLLQSSTHKNEATRLGVHSLTS